MAVAPIAAGAGQADASNFPVAFQKGRVHQGLANSSCLHIPARGALITFLPCGAWEVVRDMVMAVVALRGRWCVVVGCWCP